MRSRRLEQRALDLALSDLDGQEPDEVNGLDALLSLVTGCYWTEYWLPCQHPATKQAAPPAEKE